MAKEALARCPYTCGLCDKDGAGGNCVDLALDCAILMNVMGCDYSHLRTNCKKTCEIDTCITSKFKPRNSVFIKQIVTLSCGHWHDDISYANVS